MYLKSFQGDFFQIWTFGFSIFQSRSEIILKIHPNHLQIIPKSLPSSPQMTHHPPLWRVLTLRPRSTDSNFRIFDFSKSVRNRAENAPRPSQNQPQTIPNPSRNFNVFFLGPTPPLHQKKVRNFRTKKIEKIENFGTDLGCFGGDLGTVWGHFRHDFGPILKKSKIRKFRIEKLKFKWPQIA